MCGGRCGRDCQSGEGSGLDQVIQVAGALLILVAFALGQMGRLPADSLAYLLLNAVGSAVLAVLAALDSHWGFLLLNGTWAIVSVLGLVRNLTGSSVGNVGR